MRPQSPRFYFRTLCSPRPALIAAILIGTTTALAAFVARADESPFMAESDAAMAKMMTAMQVQPSGDADADFVAMMVPHHQGAIDMAQAELRYGHNEQLRRMAQEIIVTQLDEIAAMRLALDQSSIPSEAVPTPVLVQPTQSPTGQPVPAMTDHSAVQWEP
jgi:Domain of unknown function (DUF305)